MKDEKLVNIVNIAFVNYSLYRLLYWSIIGVPIIFATLGGLMDSKTPVPKGHAQWMVFSCLRLFLIVARV